MFKKVWEGSLSSMGAGLSSWCCIVAFMIVLRASASPALAEEPPQGALKAPEPSVLSLPYAFYNDSFGAAAGYVYGGTGYLQPQTTILATDIAGSNKALAFFLLTVVRMDIAGSKEGFGVSMMVGQPFQF